MATAEPELHPAIMALLKADGTLVGLVTGIFDLNNVPANQAFPYIVCGETTQSPMRSFTKGGQDLTVAIHTWSTYKGKKQMDAIRSAVHTALDCHDLTMEYWQGSVTYDSGNAMSDTTTNVTLMHGTDRYRIKAREI